MTKNYQEVTTPSDGRGSLAFANDNDCRRYTTLLQKDHVSVILDVLIFCTDLQTLAAGP